MSTRRKTTYAFKPDYAVPPGDTLQETIESLEIDQRELAARTGISRKTINQIIKGKAALTPDTALKLERVTGVPARMWNNLEANYREQLAVIESRRHLDEQKEWLKQIPTKELINRRVIPPTKDQVELIDHVLRFFGVADVEAWKEGWSNPQFAFRKSPTASGHDGALATWLRLAELKAHEMDCNAYDGKKFQTAVDEIRELTIEGPDVFVPAMIQRCRDCGVALVLEPEIKKAKVNGATKWLTPTKAMIALNLLGKFNDKFWFTFFHEAGHVLKDSKKQMYVDVEYTDDPREKAANDFAATTLIPRRCDGYLPGLRTYADVERFAKDINIAPGIVVGRLQRDGIIKWSHLNKLKVRLDWA